MNCIYKVFLGQTSITELGFPDLEILSLDVDLYPASTG